MRFTADARTIMVSKIPPAQFWANSRSLAAILCVLTAANCHGADPAPRSLIVEPARVLLGGANRRQQLLVTAVAADGSQLDVTRDCEFRILNPSVARASRGALVARGDGTTEVIVRLASAETRIRVEARSTGSFPPISFANDVVPILSKLGCNSAACHGKASGQNGFRLSVFGSDPIEDYDALRARGAGGASRRRVLN